MSRGRRRHALSARARRIAWSGGSVVLVALVIAIAAAFSAPKTVPLGGPSASATAGSADYNSALSALASGETTKALELLRAATAAGSTAAKSKLDELTKAPAPSAPATQAVPTADELLRKVADVTTLLPSAASGYTMSPVETSASGAIISLQPTYQGSTYGKVTVVVMTVLDKGSAAEARAYVEQLSRGYPQSGESVRIGSYAGRFGTDGARLAAAAFSRGRYAFEVVGTASRPDPTKIKDIVLGVAATFPAAN